MTDNDNIYCKIFSLPGDRTRLEIYLELVLEARPLTPIYLEQKLGLTSQTIAFHLSKLERGGLLVKQRHGRFVLYGAIPDVLSDLSTYIQSLKEQVYGKAS